MTRRWGTSTDADREITISRLRRVPLFSGLTPVQLAEMARAVRRRRYDPQEVIFFQGDPGDTLYVILSGQVKVSVSSTEGEEVILAVLDEGECFGELSLLDGEPRSATLTATQPTEVFILHRVEFEHVLTEAPDVAMRLLGVLAARLRATDLSLQDAVFLDVAGRLAKRLLLLAESHGRRVGDTIEIDLHLTQQDLASMIGATRESVNKQLGHFRERGILSFERQRITIRKPEALRARIATG